MDLFTHAILPYLLGNHLKRNKEELKALVIGAIAPDSDIFLLWINYIYPTSFLITHRGITHSFFFGLITGLIVLYLASFINKKYSKFKPKFNKNTAIFASIGIGFHLALDYITSRGIPLFYPLSDTKYAAEIFFYTDIYLTILSLGITIYLFKKPIQKNTIKHLLIIFLIIFALLGGLRIAEKNKALDFYPESDLKAYSTSNPFNWYVVSEDKDKIKIYGYNGLDGISNYNETFLRLNILSDGDGLDKALHDADAISDLRMYKWRSYMYVVNASYKEDTWHFEYYDPLRRAMSEGSSSLFRRFFASSMNVTVKDGIASMI